MVKKSLYTIHGFICFQVSCILIGLDLLLLLMFFPHGAIEIQSLATSKVFKVNGHKLKPFYEGLQVENVAKLDLEDLIYTD